MVRPRESGASSLFRALFFFSSFCSLLRQWITKGTATRRSAMYADDGPKYRRLRRRRAAGEKRRWRRDKPSSGAETPLSREEGPLDSLLAVTVGKQLAAAFILLVCRRFFTSAVIGGGKAVVGRNGMIDWKPAQRRTRCWRRTQWWEGG